MDEASTTFSITHDYVNMEYGCTQGSYTDVSFMRNTTRIFIDLIAAPSRYTSLSEIEIFEGTSLPWKRYVQNIYYSAKSSTIPWIGIMA